MIGGAENSQNEIHKSAKLACYLKTKLIESRLAEEVVLA